MKYFIVWYNETPEEPEDYTILHAYDLDDAKKMSEKMFGKNVISVEPYNP